MIRRSTSSSPVPVSSRTTAEASAGSPATPAIMAPSADSDGANTRYGRSKSVSSEVSGSSRPSRMPPRPCSTASRPSPSIANGRAPSCQSGPANSSSAGYSACGGSPVSPTW